MTKLTILVDIDDTLVALKKAWVQAVNERYNTCVSPGEITEWEVHKFFPGLSKEQVWEPLHEDSFWDTVKPLYGAREYLARLKEDGHEIYIVTNTNYQTVKAKMEKVLFKYFPFISWDDVIICSRKQLIKGDVLIDDGTHNHIGGGYFKILMDASHNRSFNADEHGICRVFGWQDVYKVISILDGRYIQCK